MNLGRIGTLFMKEIRQGATNFFFIYALIMPVVLSLIVALVFGDLFSETPRLGVYDAGESEVVASLLAEDHIQTTVYASESALRDAVERGVVMVGLVLAPDFDAAIRGDAQRQLTVIYWAESLAKDIAIINSTVDQLVMQAVEVEAPVTINSTQLGDGVEISWTERLLPVIVLMTLMLGGIMVPAASLVDEKQKRTLSALTITPATLLEVYSAKALVGVVLSTIMGLIVLILNNAFGGQPALLLTVLGLSAVSASIFGVLLGSLVKDINVLLAVIKSGALILMAPALIRMVPDLPQWIAQVFPTYYVLNPVLEVSQNNTGLDGIAVDLVVLVAIIGALVLALVLLFERQQKQLALMS
ncbi:MAG: ABC transporter permease [Phototrophicaceae bacterium]